MTKEEIARVAHEVNRAYCQALGDNSQEPWDEAPDWQKESAVKGVEFHFDNPKAGPEASHMAWLKEKYLTNWTYAKEKNAENKEHPCIVPFQLLPKEQQAKDYIFRAVVHALQDYWLYSLEDMS